MCLPKITDRNISSGMSGYRQHTFVVKSKLNFNLFKKHGERIFTTLREQIKSFTVFLRNLGYLDVFSKYKIVLNFSFIN